MKYLLDTNIIIEHLRGKRNIAFSFLEEGSAISIITQAELFYGAYKSKKPKENLNKIKQMLEELEIQVISLDQKIINNYGKLKARLEKKGKKLDEFDLLIAATAFSLKLILATQNIKHFQRISQLKLISAYSPQFLRNKIN